MAKKKLPKKSTGKFDGYTLGYLLGCANKDLMLFFSKMLEPFEIFKVALEFAHWMNKF